MKLYDKKISGGGGGGGEVIKAQGKVCFLSKCPDQKIMGA